MEDLNRAVEIANMAMEATTLDLGNCLGRRFDRTGAMEDLNRAVEVADIAVEATPLDYPGRAAILDNLGVWLGMRFDRTGATEDLERSLSSFKGGWKCHNAPPSIRINLARRAAALLVLQSKWEESSTFLQDAVLLFPMVSPRSLQNTDKQHMLTDFAGLASVLPSTRPTPTEASVGWVAGEGLVGWVIT